MKTLAELLRRGDLKVCNCCECGKLLTGKFHAGLYGAEVACRVPRGDVPPLCAGRVDDRPYCDACIRSVRPPGGHGENLTPRQAAKLIG